MIVECRHPAGIELLAAPQVRWRLALDARARPPVQHHSIAGLYGRDARSDFEHTCRRFVTEKMRQKLVRSLGGGDLVELRAADRRIQHLHQHLADAERLRERDFIDNKRRA